MDMIAKTAFPYASRRLLAGDTFQARGRSDARVLVALGRAEYAVKGASASAMPTPAAQDADPPPPGGTADPSVATLRAQYEELFGKKPFNGWDAATLSAKISEKSTAE